MRQKPLLAVDIDGVISLFGAPGPWASWSAGAGMSDAARKTAHHDTDRTSTATGNGPPETDRVPKGSLHTIEGIPHFLSYEAAAHLIELSNAFELVWASGWEERADENLPGLLGLPKGLPHLRFEQGVGRGNAHWKLDAIESYAEDRPLAWVDDALNDECFEWARERDARGAPTMLVQTAPERGLTAKEAATLAEWARGLAARMALER
jgi:hypothetical protein